MPLPSAPSPARPTAAPPLGAVPLGDVRVANKHHGVQPGGSVVYVGRPSPLGNPQPFGREAGVTREAAVTAYAPWLVARIRERGRVWEVLLGLVRRVQAGESLTLLCWCHPHACHAQVIANAIRWLAAHGTTRVPSADALLAGVLGAPPDAAPDASAGAAPGRPLPPLPSAPRAPDSRNGLTPTRRPTTPAPAPRPAARGSAGAAAQLTLL